MSVPRSHHNRPYRHLSAVGPDTVPQPAFDDPFDPARSTPARAVPEPTPDRVSSLLPFVDDFATLLDLDAEPLPDEPFDWSGVDAPDRAMVGLVLERCDAACGELLDTEFRTIARRILALLAIRDPRPLRRTSKHDRIAAGIVWLAGRGSGEFGRRAPRWRSARQVWDWFGVTNCAERGGSVRAAAGLVPDTMWPDRWNYDALPFGSVALLHSSLRSRLITDRDARLRIEREQRRWSLSPDGRSVACQAARVGPLAVTRGHDEANDQAVVLVALGGPGVGLDAADLYGLSVPEAVRLVEMLRRALAPA